MLETVPQFGFAWCCFLMITLGLRVVRRIPEVRGQPHDTNMTDLWSCELGPHGLGGLPSFSILKSLFLSLFRLDSLEQLLSPTHTRGELSSASGKEEYFHILFGMLL